MAEITIDLPSGETEIWLLPSDLPVWSVAGALAGRGHITKVEFL